MKRPGAVALASAFLVGTAFGALVFSASQTPTANAGGTASNLIVVSQWSGPSAFGKPARLQAGSLRADGRRGFVLLQMRGQRPELFSTPEGAGALSLVSASTDGWVLRSRSGALAVIDFIGFSPDNPSFSFLGRPLDPAKLGSIGGRGVAVPVGWGPWTKSGQRAHTAVVLVEATKGFPGWKLLGYLSGFSLPQGVPREHALQRPLLGPDGHLYKINALADRLVRTEARGSAVVLPLPKFGCSTWPASGGSSYRACPKSIVLRAPDGTVTTLLHRHLPKGTDRYRDWGLVQLSPNRKWMLLEDQWSSCGTASWADFLPSTGGRLVSAFPAAYVSEALGWLPDNTALVAAQTEGCAGSPPAGIYQVWPGDQSPSPQLVFGAVTEDATTWGFGR